MLKLFLVSCNYPAVGCADLACFCNIAKRHRLAQSVVLPSEFTFRICKRLYLKKKKEIKNSPPSPCQVVIN